MTEPVIDMRSDTVTRPTPGMREAIARAEVGDDMVGEDPTVNRLEARCAELFGKEAAVFACSGTQSNQLALWAHCVPGDELLIEATDHIANYEGGAPAVLSGVTCRTLAGRYGLIDVPDLEGKPRPENQHFCHTRLVCIENTTNAGGGRFYPLAQIERIGRWAHDNSLRLHMDGARFFNAAIAGGYSAADAGRHVDSISVCFSKGLGCPMGSILVGSAELIARARRARKLFGGALRQAGMVAAAAEYALDHHVERLRDDHQNAQAFADEVRNIDGLTLDPVDVQSNLVFFQVDPQLGTGAQLSSKLKSRGVLINASGPQRLRACTHLDVDRAAVLHAARTVAECVAEGFATSANSAAGPYARG